MQQRHIIIGYGYSGFHLAQSLLAIGCEVHAVSREYPETLYLPTLRHHALDIVNNTPALNGVFDCLTYFVPPNPQGQNDQILHLFLSQLHRSGSIPFKKVIYCSSSGVYGDHQGQWVNESSECRLQFDRQYRRMDAEFQWTQFCQLYQIPLVIVRTAGIYGPNRLPHTACAQGAPVISPVEAPFINHIFIEDMVSCFRYLAHHTPINGLFNLSDGLPKPMGTLQQCLAQKLGVNSAPERPFSEIWQIASPMKKEFMQANKKLNISALRLAMPTFVPTPIDQALEIALTKENVV